MLICGKVATGKGEGKKYLSEEKYIAQFEKALSFSPFPGTLNLVIEGKEREKFDILRKTGGVRISGFEKDGMKFGAVICFACMINGNIRGAIVIPEKSRYENVIEIISNKNLRKTLLLNDGDEVCISVTD